MKDLHINSVAGL